MERPNSEKFIEIFCYVSWLCTKDSGASVARITSRAKAQRRKENLSKRGSALRLCAFAREISSAKNTFCVNHVSWRSSSSSKLQTVLVCSSAKNELKQTRNRIHWQWLRREVSSRGVARSSRCGRARCVQSKHGARGGNRRQGSRASCRRCPRFQFD